MFSDIIRAGTAPSNSKTRVSKSSRDKVASGGERPRTRTGDALSEMNVAIKMERIDRDNYDSGALAFDEVVDNWNSAKTKLLASNTSSNSRAGTSQSRAKTATSGSRGKSNHTSSSSTPTPRSIYTQGGPINVVNNTSQSSSKGNRGLKIGTSSNNSSHNSNVYGNIYGNIYGSRKETNAGNLSSIYGGGNMKSSPRGSNAKNSSFSRPTTTGGLKSHKEKEHGGSTTVTVVSDRGASEVNGSNAVGVGGTMRSSTAHNPVRNSTEVKNSSIFLTPSSKTAAANDPVAARPKLKISQNHQQSQSDQTGQSAFRQSNGNSGGSSIRKSRTHELYNGGGGDVALTSPSDDDEVNPHLREVVIVDDLEESFSTSNILRDMSLISISHDGGSTKDTVTTGAARPQSRKLYLSKESGNGSVSPVKKPKSAVGSRRSSLSKGTPVQADSNVSIVQDASDHLATTEDVWNKAPSGSFRSRTNSSIDVRQGQSGSASGDGADGDVRVDGRPPSRQVAAFPVHLNSEGTGVTTQAHKKSLSSLVSAGARSNEMEDRIVLSDDGYISTDEEALEHNEEIVRVISTSPEVMREFYSPRGNSKPINPGGASNIISPNTNTIMLNSPNLTNSSGIQRPPSRQKIGAQHLFGNTNESSAGLKDGDIEDNISEDEVERGVEPALWDQQRKQASGGGNSRTTRIMSPSSSPSQVSYTPSGITGNGTYRGSGTCNAATSRQPSARKSKAEKEIVAPFKIEVSYGGGSLFYDTTDGTTTDFDDACHPSNEYASESLGSGRTPRKSQNQNKYGGDEFEIVEDIDYDDAPRKSGRSTSSIPSATRSTNKNSSGAGAPSPGGRMYQQGNASSNSWAAGKSTNTSSSGTISRKNSRDALLKNSDRGEWTTAAPVFKNSSPQQLSNKHFHRDQRHFPPSKSHSSNTDTFSPSNEFEIDEDDMLLVSIELTLFLLLFILIHICC